MEQYQISQEITLDLQQTDIPPIVKAVQYDNQCRVVAVKITNSGGDYIIPENAIASFQMKKRDGNCIDNRCAVDRSTVYVILTKQTLAFAGKYSARVCLNYGESKSVRSMPVILSIGEAVSPDLDFVSMPESQTIVELAAQTIVAANLAANSASEASDSKAAANLSMIGAQEAATAAEKSLDKALTAQTKSEEGARISEAAKQASSDHAAAANGSAAAARHSAEEAEKWAATAAGPSVVVFSVDPADGGLNVAIMEDKK